MIKILKNLTKRDIVLIIISIILMVIQIFLELKLPDYMSNITILVQSEGSEIAEIIINGLKMLLCAGISLITAIIIGYLMAVMSSNFSRNLRTKLFKKVEKFNMEEIKEFSTSSLITRTTNDITNIEMFLSMSMIVLIKAPITAVWAVLKILNKNLVWSMITGIAVLILLITIGILLVVVFPKFKIVQKLIDKINDLTRENLTGLKVIRAFNAENYQEEKFNIANNNLTKTLKFNQKTMSIMSPIMYLVMNLLTLSIYFVGAHLINNTILSNKITMFSNMVVFSSYAMQVIMSFLMFSMMFIMYPRASVSANRVLEVLKRRVSIKDGTFDGSTEKYGEVEFKNVSFKYPDSEEYLLKDISFKVGSGETIAFIGSTGSGKSTLINLVPRFYDVSEGSILIDGVDVRDYKLSSLHDKLGYVSQKAIMFNESVEYNVSYGTKEKINNNKIKESLRVAQANTFIESMKDKYKSNISQGGANISGGQKQRISIARAIYKNPEIYIFDDSFSALDYKTDYNLRNELNKYTANSTKMIVASRVGTILNANKIVVLDKGNCVGIGTHKELLKKCKVYKEIAYSQLSKEELENA